MHCLHPPRAGLPFVFYTCTNAAVQEEAVHLDGDDEDLGAPGGAHEPAEAAASPRSPAGVVDDDYDIPGIDKARSITHPKNTQHRSDCALSRHEACLLANY